MKMLNISEENNYSMHIKVQPPVKWNIGRSYIQLPI